jgi:hypothetical protein
MVRRLCPARANKAIHTYLRRSCFGQGGHGWERSQWEMEARLKDLQALAVWWVIILSLTAAPPAAGLAVTWIGVDKRLAPCQDAEIGASAARCLGASVILRK